MTKDEILASKHIVLLGFGKEGRSTHAWIKKIGYRGKITVADKNPVPDLQNYADASFVAGDGYLNALLTADIVFKSPGIPESLKELDEARKRGVEVTSQTEVFFHLYKKQIIGVTGSKGKSTTSSLIYEVLKAGGVDAVILGNIGVPPLEKYDEIKADTVIVYELSSFQLQPLRVSPHVAVMQVVVPAHLDIHSSFEEYVSAKQNIVRYQDVDDVYVYNKNLDIPAQSAELTKGKVIAFTPDDLQYSGYKSRLPGDFNRTNIIPAIIIGKLYGVKDDTIQQAIEAFKPLAHRLESIGTHKGIEFIDDSLGTLVPATIEAIHAIKNAETLITGGFHSGQDYQPLALAIIDSTIKNVICFPETGEVIANLIASHGGRSDLRVFMASSMEEAVRLAYTHTKAGKTCLMSCAAPSFGLFKNYLDRAEQFKYWVEKLV